MVFFLYFLKHETLILDTTPEENMNGFDNKSAWNSVSCYQLTATGVWYGTE
jgi:hypothetical protein